MEIISTQPGDKNFHLFEGLIKQLYPENSIRHTQSESINKEFLTSCFVLTVNDEPKARVTLYNNPNLTYNAQKSMCIGNYECVDDHAIAEHLLKFITNEAKKTGAEFLIGPMNGSTWDNYRFSTHHDYPIFLLEPYHHLYYNQQFTEAGFSPISQYTSSIDTELECNHPDILKRETELLSEGVVIRSINMNDYEGELKKLYPVITNSFKSNFLYTPIKWETFLKKYLEAGKIINPEYVLIAEDKQGDIIGFIFAYDDLYNRTQKCLVVKTLARHESKQWSGLGQVLSNKVVNNVKNKGYTSLIHAFIISHGTSRGTSEKFHGKVFKNYALYGKSI